MRRLFGATALAAGLSIGVGVGDTPPAEAFCGFYVGGADAKLFNNATQVVLMRAGTRTVLSMQDDYQGPPRRSRLRSPPRRRASGAGAVDAISLRDRATVERATGALVYGLGAVRRIAFGMRTEPGTS